MCELAGEPDREGPSEVESGGADLEPTFEQDNAGTAADDPHFVPGEEGQVLQGLAGHVSRD